MRVSAEVELIGFGPSQAGGAPLPPPALQFYNSSTHSRESFAMAVHSPCIQTGFRQTTAASYRREAFGVTQLVIVLPCVAALLSIVASTPERKPLAGTRTAISLLAKGAPRSLTTSTSAAFLVSSDLAETGE